MNLTTGCKRIILDGDTRDFLDYRKGSGDTVEIFDIQVGSERGVGKGRRLIELLFKLCSDASTVYAITRTSNLIAQQFYEKLQFSVTGVLRKFYRDEGGTVDAIMYGRSPKGPV